MDERGLSEVETVLPPASGSPPLAPTEGSGWATGQSDPGSDSGTKEKVKEQAANAAASAKEVAATTTGEARQVAGTAAEGARDVAKETGRQVGEVASQAANQAKELLGQTTGQLKEQASAQTGRAAEGLRTVTSQLRALSTGRPEEAGAVGDYARQATDKIEQLASRLDERGVDGIMDDVQRFARRRPGVFLLGAGVAGFFAGRFLRGSQAASQDEPSPPPRWETPGLRGMDLEPDVLVVTTPPEASMDVIGETAIGSPIGTETGRATGAL